MSRLTRSTLWNWGILPTLSITLLFTVLPGRFDAGQANAAGGGTGTAQSGVIAPSGIVTANPNDVVTPAMQQAHDAAVAQHDATLRAPSKGTTAVANEANPGPSTQEVGQPLAPGDLGTRQNLTLPASALCSGCALSSTDESRVARAGHSIFQTGNWYAAYSQNNGAPSTALNPYTLFGSNFCCDQDTTYVPSRDRYFWSLLYYGGNGNVANRIVIANSASTNLSSWCNYTFYPDAFGGTRGDTQDFPKIAYSNNNLYLSFNEYNSSGNWIFSALVRLPLDQMASCATVNYNYLTRTDQFSFSLARGSQETMYWVGNWYTNGTTNGANLRIYTWAENSTTYFYFDRGINAYTFGNAACNWCGRLDPRYAAAWISRADYRGFGDDWLGVAISAGPSNFDSHNYVVYEYFTLHGLSYKGNDQTYNASFDFAYPSAAPNARGAVGIDMVQGTNPGNILVVQDDYAASQPWSFNFWLNGTGSSSGWGDYTGAEPAWPDGDNWIATGWIINASNAVEVHNVVFGRGRDNQDFQRWKSK